MDRVRARGARGGEDLALVQIGLRGRGGADGDGLVRLADVGRIGVRVREDRDGGDIHGAGGADDPAGDLAAVGDEELVHDARRSSGAGRGVLCV